MSSDSLATTNGSGRPPHRLSGARRIRRIGALVAAAILGAATGLFGLLAFTAVQSRARLPQLDPATFYENQDKWGRSGLSDYRLSVQVTGRQAAEYFVEVRGGQVQEATRDGEPLRQRRTMGTWSVPGMFTTMQSDVANLEKHRQDIADRQTPQVLLRGQFDPQLGYPVRYHRTQLQKWGSNAEVSWEVTSFTPLDESN